MEYQNEATDIDDAKDIFLLAKDRLLDVNDWGLLLRNSDLNINLTDSKGRKAHRDARVADKVQISTLQNGTSSDMWTEISRIQYDYFPDIDCETISMLLSVTSSPSGNGVEYYNKNKEAMETILIKRSGQTVIAHCNAGNELPEITDTDPDAHINNAIDRHPVLNIPKEELQQLLQNLISADLYTV